MLLGKHRDVVKNSQVHFVMLDKVTSYVLNPKVYLSKQFLFVMLTSLFHKAHTTCIQLN